MPADKPSVLQLGDMSRVSADLTKALLSHGEWDAHHHLFGSVGSGWSSPWHELAVPLRAASVTATSQFWIRRHRPDIVHLHWARLAPLVHSRSTPLVVHAHGDDVRDQGTTRSGLSVLRSLEQAAHVFASTPDLLAHLPEGAEYLPNPVNSEFFSPGSTDEREPDRIFFFSRWDTDKGAAELLEAARILARHKDVQLIGCDQGTRWREAQGPHIQLLPYVGRPQVRDQLRRASVVIGQQGLGVFGRSESEALSCGVPVLMKIDLDLYEDARPPIVAVQGGEEIAHTALSLLEDTDRRTSVGAQSRTFIEDVHGFPETARRLTDTYNRLRR